MFYCINTETQDANATYGLYMEMARSKVLKKSAMDVSIVNKNAVQKILSVSWHCVPVFIGFEPLEVRNQNRKLSQFYKNIVSKLYLWSFASIFYWNNNSNLIYSVINLHEFIFWIHLCLMSKTNRILLFILTFIQSVVEKVLITFSLLATIVFACADPWSAGTIVQSDHVYSP